MARQTIHLEWYIGEEHWPKAPVTAGDAPLLRRDLLTVDERQVAVFLLRAVGVVLTAFLVLGSSALSPGQAQAERAWGELQLALSAEERAWQTNDRELYKRLVSSSVERAWLNEWRDYWRVDPRNRLQFGTNLLRIEAVGNYLLADILITRPAVDWWSISPYRETRVYIRTANGWLRTIPPLAFWGEQRVIETDYLRLEFYERDAATVQAVVADVERVYIELHHVLALEPPTRRRKLTVTIAPSTSRGWSRFWNRIDITTPVLSRIPQQLSSEEYLVRVITDQFVGLSLNRAMSRYGNAYVYRWGAMIWAMRGWLEGDVLGEPSPWHKQSEKIFLSYSDGRFPFSLDDVTNSRNRNEGPDPQRLFWQYMAANSMIDYTIETYGREQLPQLLQMWGTGVTWDELIPQLFNTSRTEFESAWNDYLARRYGW